MSLPLVTPGGVRKDLYAILERHAEEGCEITSHATISGDLALDSLGVMEVIADIESRFRVRVPDEQLPELSTVADVERALVQFLKASGRIST